MEMSTRNLVLKPDVFRNCTWNDARYLCLFIQDCIIWFSLVLVWYLWIMDLSRIFLFNSSTFVSDRIPLQSSIALSVILSPNVSLSVFRFKGNVASIINGHTYRPSYISKWWAQRRAEQIKILLCCCVITSKPLRLKKKSICLWLC